VSLLGAGAEGAGPASSSWTVWTMSASGELLYQWLLIVVLGRVVV
jgi:hypothetical protein